MECADSARQNLQRSKSRTACAFSRSRPCILNPNIFAVPDQDQMRKEYSKSHFRPVKLVKSNDAKALPCNEGSKALPSVNRCINNVKRHFRGT